MSVKARLSLCFTPFALTVILSCATSSSTQSDIRIKGRGPDRLRSIGLLLYSFQDKRDKRVDSILRKESLDPYDYDSIAEEVRIRMTNMLGQKLTTQDRASMHASGTLFLSYYLLSKQSFANARLLADKVLDTDELSTQHYVYALSADAIAEIMLAAPAQQPSNANTADAPAPKLAFDFQAFQNSQCQRLCGTAGWQRLALESADAFSEKWYERRVYSSSLFRTARLKKPKWFVDAVAIEKKETLAEPGVELPVYAKLHQLMNQNRMSEALAIAKKNLREKINVKTCNPSAALSEHFYAQSRRRAQDRDGFLKHQERLVDWLTKSTCSENDFRLVYVNPNEFTAFRVNAKIWLGRLYWEKARHAPAYAVTESALKEAQTAGLWELYFEAAQVLVGRIGFETLSPEENLKLIAMLEGSYRKGETNEFESWVDYKKGLLLFLDGKFELAAKHFERLDSKVTETAQRAAIQYWRGRALAALKQQDDALSTFMLVGATDPLSIYDIFAGQYVGEASGRVSSIKKSPFDVPWYEERDKWISLKASRPFPLFEQLSWLNPFAAKAEGAIAYEKEFELSLRSTLLLVTALRAVEPQLKFEEFSTILRDTSTIDGVLLRSEAGWLKNTFKGKFIASKKYGSSGDQIAWLLYVTGDYINSILFIGSLRGSLEFRSTPSSFLYFIFYPRPYYKEYQDAAERCGVDIDILYAISRQESLFQREIQSGAGAIGLMQLMPATAKRVLSKFPEYAKADSIDLRNPATNTLAGACYIKNLLERYNGNLAYAISAYNAGEKAVDGWIRQRTKFKDIPFFTEFIPYAETQKYTQRVLRNYYNIKWIYAAPETSEAKK